MKSPYITWKRGLTRSWFLAAVFWYVYILVSQWDTVRYATEYALNNKAMASSANAAKQKRIGILKNELVSLPQTRDDAKRKYTELSKTGSISYYDEYYLKFTMNRQAKDIEDDITEIERQDVTPKKPQLDWISLIVLPPILIPICAISVFYLLKWLISGFIGKK